MYWIEGTKVDWLFVLGFMFIFLVVRLCLLLPEALSEAKISPVVFWVPWRLLKMSGMCSSFSCILLLLYRSPIYMVVSYGGGGKVFYTRMIWSVSEPIVLSCVLQKCFSVFLLFFPLK